MTKDTKDSPGKASRKADPRSSGEHHEHAGQSQEGAAHASEGSSATAHGEHAHAAAEDTTEDVLHAFRKGRADAIEAAERTLPAVKKSVSKGTYMLCYYVSFAAVYTGELAMSAVPQDSVIRHGLKDGAAAAKEAHAQRQVLRPQNTADAAI
jgi:hypothetical protein